MTEFKHVDLKARLRNAIEDWEVQCSEANAEGMEVYEKLLALGNDPRKEDIDEVIGNTAWTEFYCDICGKELTEGVETQTRENDMCGYREPEEYPVFWCSGCLQKAAR